MTKDLLNKIRLAQIEAGENEVIKNLQEKGLILANGTKEYCSSIYSVQQYAKGNCPLNDVEASIKAAMSEYAEQESIAFKDWCDKLSVTQRCTVHPPAGSGSGTGLYEKSTAQLYAQYTLYQESKTK